MKHNRVHLSKGREGTLSMTPEDSDDIWLLYNLVQPGDEVEAVTFRKILLESSSGLSDSTKKIRLVLAVSVERVDVDLDAPGLRIGGKNTKPTEHVKLGAHHTLDIEPGRNVKLYKPQWDRLHLQLVRQASDPTAKCLVGAIVCQDSVAHVCAVDNGAVKVLLKLDGLKANDKRFAGSSKADAAIEKFFSGMLQAIDEHFDVSRLKCLILASKEPEWREGLYTRLLQKHNEHRAKFLRFNAASGQPTALEALLKEPRIQAILADTKGAQDAKLMDAVHKLLNDDDAMVCFGDFRHLMVAARRGAIKHLLLLDTIFRSTDVQERQRVGNLVDEVTQNGGAVAIFAEKSEPAIRLAKLAGMAAILLYPMSAGEYEE